MTLPDLLAHIDTLDIPEPTRRVLVELVRVAIASREDTGAEPSVSVLARAHDTLDRALAALPPSDAEATLPLRLCGYCKSWHRKPCGEDCCWSVNDPTVDTVTAVPPSAALPQGWRLERQRDIAAWASATFGAEQASSIPQRAVRLLEEAVEAYQAADGTAAMAHKLIDFVFARPAGNLTQELGGVGVCLLCLAEAAGVNADDTETNEIARIKSKPLEHFRERNNAKNDAGFLAISPPPSVGGEPECRKEREVRTLVKTLRAPVGHYGQNSEDGGERYDDLSLEAADALDRLSRSLADAKAEIARLKGSGE